MRRRWARLRETVLIGLGLVLACCDRPPSPPRPSPSAASSTPSSVTADETIFVEAAGDCGLDVTHFTGATGEYHLPEIMGAGGAFLDHDGDGDLDVYFLQGAPLRRETGTRGGSPPHNRLFRNALDRSGGRPRFTDVTSTAGVGDTGYALGCAVGDYDNDGDPDLYVTNFGPNVLYRNNGDGTFTNVTATAGVTDPRLGASAEFLDFDRDGRLDLFVTNYADYALAANRECTRLGGQRDYCGPLSYEAVSDTLFHNNGDGTFTDVSVQAGIHLHYGYGLGVACTDFDSDGLVDIFVANDATPNQLWINRGDGRFEDRALIAGVAVNGNGENEAGMGVTSGDFDGDGDDDLFLSHEMGETNTLYRNLGKALFEDATYRMALGQPSVPYAGFGTRWFDYDNDGRVDIFVANGSVRMLASQRGVERPYAQPDQLFHNDGKVFRETTDGAGLNPGTSLAGRGAAFGDVDNDGDIDVLVFSNGGPLRLFLNRNGNRGNWVRLVLVGKTSSRDATGTRVRLKLADGTALWQRAHSGGSYCSASDSRVHFGLGDSGDAVSVTVYWVDGRIETWDNISAGLQHTLVEGSGAEE